MSSHRAQTQPPKAVTRARRRFGRGTSRLESITSAERFDQRDDLRMARDFQRSLLPPIPEEYRGVRMAAAYYPAFDIGGDFYELLVEPDRLLVVIGDVAGKGVAAAMVMSRIMAEFRRYGHERLQPHELLATVNDVFVNADLGGRFVTACCVELEFATGKVSIANAGHVPALLRRANGEVAVCGDASGAPLGLFEGETYRTETVECDPDDILVLVTDGVTEALEPKADPASGVLTSLMRRAEHDVRLLARDIVNSVTVGAKGLDDVALFAVQL